MIGYLSGLLKLKRPPELIIDVSGVGYTVLAPMTTFYKLGEPGTTVCLWVESIMKQDSFQMYGFYHIDDKHLFQQLIKVNGVGPKTALAMLSTMSAQDIADAIQFDQPERLSTTPGIGKKTAERLCLELADRMKNWSGKESIQSDLEKDNPKQDATDALIALGYKNKVATDIIKTIYEDNLRSDQIIRRALQEITRRDSTCQKA